MRRKFAILLSVAMLASVVGCKDNTKEVPEKEKTYTYNVGLTKKITDFNPHTLEENVINPVDEYCQMGFVEAIGDENNKFIWSYEMADSISDITGSFQDKEKYEIKEEETGRVWQIKLNKAAVWEDGTQINADTYMSSMKLLLDWKMKNSAATIYCDEKNSSIAIYNANKYFNNDLSGKELYSMIYDANAKTYALDVVDVQNMYISLVQPTSFWGYSLIEAYNSYGADYFTGSDGTDYYKIIEKAVGDKEYMLVNDEIIQALKGICEVVGDGHKEEFMEMLFYKSGIYEQIGFENVGLIKVDDYTLNYVTAKSVSEEDFYKGMSNNWIVKEDLYTANLNEEGEYTVTSYGLALENYQSYGPYKLVKIEDDKLIIEKNELWYGYNDAKNEGQFQTTSIVVKYVENADEMEQLFLTGKIDEMLLDENKAISYSNSERIYTIPDTCTYRWIFATDMDRLVAMEKDLNDGSNKRVLNYDGFRKALSYAIDRVALCNQATSNGIPAVYLLSDAYYIDNTNSHKSKYRECEEAKKALVNLYGLTYGDSETYKNLDEAYNAISGYDVEKAKELFNAVYSKAVSDGNYTDGQAITLRCIVSSAKELTKWEIAEEKAINEMLNLATKGTGFEGKLSVKYMCGVDNRYNECIEGRIEMIKGAWAGSVVSPFLTIGMYTVSEYAGNIQESCGWDPNEEVLGISYDFDGDGEVETLNKTYRQWTLEMNDMSIYGQNMKSRLVILSSLESGILSQYQCMPLSTETSSKLLSYKVDYGFAEYNAMYEYGGLRFMVYNYDDDSYKEYVESQGGSLKYE